MRANVYVEIQGSRLDPRFEAYLNDAPTAGAYAEPRFTKPIAEEVVAWTNRIAEGSDESPICEWSKEGYVLVFTPDSPFRPSAVVQPDDDGLYALGLGWAWQVEEVDQ
ncbi:hypothetical protein AB5J62_33335 [Amycolatopsis sp. cg5]|uniref:hypothetical protein n=1 Tax=Amycolatopsis sp. cg5 TaxID=3238802 RepID=UPI003525E94C